jgi:integrase
MRLGEISQICRKDIRKEHGILCFDVCHDTKTDSSKRLVPISDKLKPYIETLLRESKSEKLFENCGDLVRGEITMKHANRYGKFFNIYAKKISPDLSFHNLRHYTSTQMQKEGVEKLLRDKLLGHSNDTTSAIYTHPELVELKKAVDKIR